MALLNQSVQVYGKLDLLFEKLREGQAPDKFNRAFITDLGFKSSNWHAAIGLLKGLGFLSSDGTPTSQYMELLDKTKWRVVLGKALQEAYSDIFVMKREPGSADLQMISGKYKSTYNMSNTAAERAARTFLSLLELSDTDSTKREAEPKVAQPKVAQPKVAQPKVPQPEPPKLDAKHSQNSASRAVGLNYNIQIHLPATKDIEVYNAIFKSLREHIID